MSCVTPVGRILDGKADPREGFDTSSMTKDVSNSPENQDQRTEIEPLCVQLPLSHPNSSLLSTALPPSDQAYLQASIIFQELREEKPVKDQHLHYEKKNDTALPEIGDKPTQRQAYQLAFNTLKYQDLLEDVIIDSCFHISQHISSDLLPLAMVMLFDFQHRRFLLHEHFTEQGEERLPEVRALQGSLHRWKTKLAASLARCRVKHSLKSVSSFLSDDVRTKHQRAKRLPLYAWVNTLQISVEEVCDALQAAGLSEGKNFPDPRESAFCRDPLCPDTLVLPQHLHALLERHSLTATHVLNIQDRSLCVAVSVLRPLLFDYYDVLVVGSVSARTVAHVAVATAERSGRVLLCGADHPTPQLQEIQELLADMNVKNVQVMSGAFYGLDEWDVHIKHVRITLVLPRCSCSALSDPVATIHSEHGDWDLLPDLSRGSVSKRKINTLAAQQAKLLEHALNFSKVQTVVYCTRSVHPEENEQLVKRVLEKAHTHPKLLPFRVNGPIFPDESQAADTTLDSKFFRLEPSPLTNGCFVARLSRQADPTKVETVQDVLARAAAKGLLGEMIPERSKTVKRGKNRKNRVDPGSSEPASPTGEERQTGRELGTELDPDGEERGEGDFRASEEEEEHTNEKDKGEKKVKKNRGHKLKLRRAPKQTSKEPKSHKNKRKKSKPRRIPRLTLTLMSSAKASKHLSPITAAAHKLIDSPGVKPQQASDFSAPSSAGKRLPPASSTPYAASKQVKTPSAQPGRRGQTLQDPSKAGGEGARPEIKVVTHQVKKTDLVLPPISSASSLSLRSKSGSSISQPPSETSQAQLSNASGSSPSIYLPGL